jgi:hypothetical protein
MIDRKARDQMCKAIRSYLNEETTAFQLDNSLCDANIGTKDRTVTTVMRALWFHCKDHKIAASKEEWDYFNRLLLLLESDAKMEIAKKWREWNLIQGIAALLFVGFFVIGIQVGFSYRLFAIALPFGPPSLYLYWLNSCRLKKEISAAEIALLPFQSLGILRAVHRQVGGFVKDPYPRSVENRRIRGPIVEKLILVPWALFWCLFSPAFLFFQLLPDRKYETKVIMPESSARRY